MSICSGIGPAEVLFDLYALPPAFKLLGTSFDQLGTLVSVRELRESAYATAVEIEIRINIYIRKKRDMRTFIRGAHNHISQKLSKR
jgi:hypothetical protein